MADVAGWLLDLGAAFAIGMLIGLQREQSGAGVLAAGSRTFPLVAIAGAVCQLFFPAALPFALGGVVLLAGLGYVVRVRESGDPGLATPVAVVLTFLLGALSTWSADARVVAVMLGVVTTIVLALKAPLHGFARRLTQEEMRAALTFLVVALVVLPVLPDREIGALFGLNPRFIWLMVVFVSAIDLAAFLFVRFFATRRGHVTAGVVGGLVSSTATTVSMARRARSRPDLESLFCIGIVIASCVMLVRMAVVVAVLDVGLLRSLGLPLLLMFLWCVAWVVWWFRTAPREEGEGPGPRNPFRLVPALLFGLFFAFVLLATRWLHAGFGTAGVVTASLASGLVDVDAITMSLARLHAQGGLTPATAAFSIVLVGASNFCFKIAIMAVLGSRRLAWRSAAALASGPVVAVAVAWWWL